MGQLALILATPYLGMFLLVIFISNRMLGEGAYLQLLLINTWRVKTWQIWAIIVGAWGLPLVSIVPYSYVRAGSEAENRA